MKRPCLDCHQLTTNGSRCPTCTTRRNRNHQNNRPTNNRAHHTDPTYRRISKQLRTQWNTDPTTRCWLCGDYARPGDPWQADHIIPGDITLEGGLAPAHRSCNARRGNRT